MSLNINYIKMLSTITVVIICINYSNSAPIIIEQNNSAKKQNNKQIKNKGNQQTSNINSNLTLLDQKIRYNTKNDQQIQYQNDINPAPFSLVRKNAIRQFKQDKPSNQQINSNTNSNINPAPIPEVQQYNQNKSNNQQAQMNTQQIHKPTQLPLGHKNYTPQPEEQYKQFITESDDIIKKINKNKNNISDAFNASYKEQKSVKNKIFFQKGKQKGDDTKAILQILLDNYKKLSDTISSIKNLISAYNFCISKNDDPEGAYNAIGNDKAIEAINIIQQLEYDSYIPSILQTTLNNYKYINGKERDYKKEGWYTKKEFKKFCKLLSEYIGDFDTLRIQFIELCNKYLGTLKQQAQQQLSEDPMKQLINCINSNTQYITSKINYFLSIINNQFDKKKLNMENELNSTFTSRLNKTLLERNESLLNITEYIEQLLRDNATDGKYKTKLDELIGYNYKMYLTNIAKFFYKQYIKSNYKTEGCKSEFVFKYFIDLLSDSIDLFVEIFNNELLNKYNNTIIKIYSNQASESIKNTPTQIIIHSSEKEKFINIAKSIQQHMKTIQNSELLRTDNESSNGLTGINKVDFNFIKRKQEEITNIIELIQNNIGKPLQKIKTQNNSKNVVLTLQDIINESKQYLAYKAYAIYWEELINEFINENNVK